MESRLGETSEEVMELSAKTESGVREMSEIDTMHEALRRIASEVCF